MIFPAKNRDTIDTAESLCLYTSNFVWLTIKCLNFVEHGNKHYE